MKTYITCSLVIVLFILSCNKEKDESEKQFGISYPDSIYYGANILAMPDSTILFSEESYGMGAELEKDASLSIKITNLSVIDSVGHIAMWFYDENTGWIVGDYSENNQIFSSAQTDKIDLDITFRTYFLNGSCRIDFYENSTAITRTKYIMWE